MTTAISIIGALALAYGVKVVSRHRREKKAQEALREKVRGRLGIGAENGHPT